MSSIIKQIIKSSFISFFICVTSINAVNALESAKLIFAADMNEIGSESQAGYAQVASLLDKNRQEKLPVFFKV